MKTKLIAQVAIVAVIAAASPADAIEFSLDFSSAVGGTIMDTGGEGTGFTNRLSGTGGAIAASDPNLDLDTTAGVLRMTGQVAAEPNGPLNVDNLEMFGIQLASLGFNSSRDFSLTASFLNVPDNSVMDSFDQFGIFVGTNSLNHTRAMVINFDFFGNNNEFAAANNINGADTGQHFNLNPTPAGNMSFTISRSSGVWTYTLVGTSGSFIGTATRTPAQPTFLNSLNDLTAGVFFGSTNTTPYTVELDSFVVNVPVPGDADNDGDVDEDDFFAISDNLFDTVPPGTMGDANLDGVVTYGDFRLWKDNFVGPFEPGSGAGSAASLPIPEPSGLMLAVMAVLGLLCGRRLSK